MSPFLAAFETTLTAKPAIITDNLIKRKVKR
jgi:hypothetical protein